jgi:hypothetical protein
MRRVLLLLFLGALLASATATARAPTPDRIQANCDRTSVGFDALPDLGQGTHRGYQGGLYPGGLNEPPAAYRKQGLAAAGRVHPIDGKIVLLSIGMSNTTQEYSRFKMYADLESVRNPAVVIVDGAQGGQDAQRIRNPKAPYWQYVDQRLAGAQATRAQVQAVWLKQAIAGENRVFPADAVGLQGALRDIIGILRDRFVNLELVYLSSRIYAGYASTNLNPEPYAYQSSFAVKWAIQERIDGAETRPWLGWGPYLWTDGLNGRRMDGVVWLCSDTTSDGTHPSTSGREKVAKLLWHFFEEDETATPWFLRPSLSR